MVRFYGMERKKKTGKLIRMAGYRLDDENSFEEPEKVAPKTQDFVLEEEETVLKIPAHSVNIFVI